MKNLLFILLVGVTVFTSCDKNDSTSTDQTLTGKIRGVEFTFGNARYGSISDDKYRVIVSNIPSLQEPCSVNLDDVYIDFKPTKTLDKIEMESDGFSTGPNTVVFHHPDFFQNLIIDKSGYYQITSEQDSTITIEMDFRYNDDNYMKGSFIATKCF